MDQVAFKSICNFIAEQVPCGVAIMGEDGIILASSEPTDVGKRHQRAALVVAGLSDREDVTAEEANDSDVMLEGCNVPLVWEGQRIASLGIAAPLSLAHQYADIAQAFIKLELEYNQRKEKLVQQLEEKNQLLHESGMVLQQVLDNIPAGVFWKDQKLQYLGCNQRFAEDMGLGHPADVIGLTDADLAWVNRSDLVKHAERKLLDTGVSELNCEEVRHNPKQQPVWLRVNKVPMRDHQGQIVGMMGTYENISESKAAIAELQAANSRFRTAFNSSPMMIVLSDIHTGEYIDVNRRYEEVMNCSREQLIGRTSLEIGGWADKLDRQQFIETLLRDGRVDAYSAEIHTLDGKRLEVLVTGRIVNLEGVDRLLVYIEDVTERNQIDRELRSAKQYISDIINSMPSILIGVNSEGRISHWNTQAEKATAVKYSEAIGQPVEHLLQKFQVDLPMIKQAIQQQEMARDNCVVLNSEGESSYYELTIYPLKAQADEGAVIRIDDVSERIKIEEMIVQSEKMLSIGGLAAGMAHEINNPLAGILQNVQVIHNRLTAETVKNSEFAERCGISMEQLQNYMEERGVSTMVENATEAGKRAAQIVENMLSFSRKESQAFELVDVRDLIDKTLELAANDYSIRKRFDFRHIQIIKSYPDQCPPVPCHVSKVQQVLLNLLKNGAQAMLKSRGDDRQCRFELRVKCLDEAVVIEVEDNGPGIDEEVRKRIFEPFFTTKSKGSGTGLGLSVSYFIISKDHNGFMDVRSTPGEGACFIIGLPLSQTTSEK